MALNGDDTAVEFDGIGVAFGDCVANDHVAFKVRAGSIHGLVGENGAGKSTAMKILYGLVKPDRGTLKVKGKVVKYRGPRDSMRDGIGMVHQHFMLAEPYSALENVVIGYERPRGILRFLGPLAPTRLRGPQGQKAELEVLAKKNGFDLPWDRAVEDLSVGEQQRIEILKTLYRGAEILILDEPTAVLTPQETDDLFKQLRVLRSQGKTIILITHKLKEILAITDSVTVMRAGKVVGSAATADLNESKLADWMVGRSVELRKKVAAAERIGEPVLKLKDVTFRKGGRGLHQVNLTVRAGEIVGVAGVEGNGQSELLDFLLSPGGRGNIELFGSDISNEKPREIRSRGVGFIPEDRHRYGVLLNRPVWENFILGHEKWPEFSQAGLLKTRSIATRTSDALERHDVRPRDGHALLKGLSGGNQQKLVVAREMDKSPRLIVAAQPTRGVDVGAIEAIHQAMVEARDKGAGILLISSELDEVMTLSDRILVFYQGRIVSEYLRGSADERRLGLDMGGSKSA